jgi:hypothetical protein
VPPISTQERREEKPILPALEGKPAESQVEIGRSDEQAVKRKD